MKLYRLPVGAALLVAVLAVAGGISTARADSTCTHHTDAVFYTTDTLNLAKALAAVGTPCTDYYLSVTPTGTGMPRVGPVDAVHALGPNFHVMPEIRPAVWSDWIAAHTSTWYDAGVAARAAMLAAHYSPAFGDLWAINEVGTPSGQQSALDVFAGAGNARTDLEEFVRGLYTGDGTPEQGLVFAANPPQMATGVFDYEQGLAHWYADSSFWQHMQGYVRFWAQETYADARSWGVDGSSPADRADALNAYFTHGTRLAQSNGVATAAARTFLASAYTLLGNASYRYGIPDPSTGPAFGYTDIGVPGMLSFISAQTDALRSSSGDRFGFAVSPSKPLDPAWPQIYARVAGSIHDSDGDAAGACAAGSCDGVVAGGMFPTTWPTFATPPVITAHLDGPHGQNGWYTGPVTVSWEISDGQTPIWSTDGCETVTVSTDTPSAVLTCTATSSGGIASARAEVALDATPPAVTCRATPDTLWPPSGKLEPVSVSVEVGDATSGPGGFTLTAAPSTAAAGFTLGTPDTAGLLRARRAGNGGDRVYTLTYVARDVAGNTATCDATVTVPHDRGE